MKPVATFVVLFALAASSDTFAQQPSPAPAAPAAPVSPAPARPPAAAPPAPRAVQAPRPVTQAPRPVAPGSVPAPAPAPAAPPLVSIEPNQPGQLVNIQIDITLTSEGGAQ